MPPKNDGIKVLATNRQAYHNYFIQEKFEAGIELFGTEVKSIRGGHVNLKDAFCAVKSGELYVYNMHISPYEQGNVFNKDPMRPKRLLMHKKEIRRLQAGTQQDGFTLVPLSVYLKGSLVKVQISLAKGKKLYDKRESDAKRDADREIRRTLREKNN